MKQERIFLICLNPKCSSPNRCLDSNALHKHPQQCLHHLFPVQTISDTEWNEIQNYPSDPVGKQIRKKIKTADSKAYIRVIFDNIRKQINKIIQEAEKQLIYTYPGHQLYDQYQDIYRLDKIAHQLKNKQAPSQLNKFLNQKFTPARYDSLILLNDAYDLVEQATLSAVKTFEQTLLQICKSHSKQKRYEMSVQILQKPKAIDFGFWKSKYIASAKIQCLQGQVLFPKVKDAGRFLPWVYSEKAFDSGIHQLKITSGKYPGLSNAGFCILQQTDKDVYPYMIYKSLFSKQGKNFDLCQGDHIEQFITQMAIVKLRLQFTGKKKIATISDSQRKCKYECELQSGKQYRMGLYGSGWSVVVLQMT